VTANFSQNEYLLEVSASPAEGGSVLVSPPGPYHLNDLVTLTPQAAVYWTFQDWGGRNSNDLIDNHNGTWGLVMDEDKSVKANFTPISINIQDAVVQEGDTGTVAMTFNLTLLTPASELTTVNYHTSDGSAVAGSDYETASGTVVFQPGDQSETITVQVTGDLLDEEDETFDVILSDPGGVIPLDETGVGTILDDDDQPNLTIVPSIDLFEGNSGVVNAVFTLTLSTASGKTVIAHYETVDGAAKGGNPIVQGIDYLSMNDQVVFAPGEVMKRIWVPLNPDDICEAYETFYLDLSEVENAQLLLDRSQATIKNEDPCFVFLPIINYRKMIFSDYFNSEAGWEEVPEFKSDWFILLGEYHGKHVIPDRNTKAIAPVTSAQLDGSYSVEVNLRSEIGSGNDGRGGLLFDYLGNNATYRFVIIPRATSGNNWFVQVRNTDLSQWDTLGSGLDHVHIISGDGVNVLRIERSGPQIRAYVNDYLLWEGNDSTFMMGRVGLNIGTPVDLAPDKYIEFAFDNFLIGSLP
jgi:hypothetical protein